MKDNRRAFIKKAALAGATIPSLSFANQASITGYPSTVQEDVEIEPSKAQKEWMGLKFGLFIHFCINTYYDMEWS